jgi:hypothetical protein
MAKLTSKARKALPKSDFAVAGRKYPVNDPSHARDALSRVSANGSPAEKAEVRAKVHRKFPGIGKGSADKHMSHSEFESMDHGSKHDHMIGRSKGRC